MYAIRSYYVSAISILEKRREELRTRIMNTFAEKEIDVLRVGHVELKRHRVDWKLWHVRKLKPYLMERELWDMVESVDRKTLSTLVITSYSIHYTKLYD